MLCKHLVNLKGPVDFSLFKILRRNNQLPFLILDKTCDMYELNMRIHTDSEEMIIHILIVKEMIIHILIMKEMIVHILLAEEMIFILMIKKQIILMRVIYLKTL